MTMARLGSIVQALDPDVIARGPALEFTLEDIPVIVIADPRADRMRAMVPIASADGLKEADLMRLMQANFDAALDARYAVAHGKLWGCLFIRCHRWRRMNSFPGWCRPSLSHEPTGRATPEEVQSLAVETATRFTVSCWKSSARRANLFDLLRRAGTGALAGAFYV
ncbi:hypothetical protein [Sulfitobacter sediminilitoris]|uniref:hypothetical protein n=1 Tax=Sulfitobacter sediminilitoris TaxID=2698830 RepID=UPI0036DD9F9A